METWLWWLFVEALPIKCLIDGPRCMDIIPYARSIQVDIESVKGPEEWLELGIQCLPEGRYLSLSLKVERLPPAYRHSVCLKKLEVLEN